MSIRGIWMDRGRAEGRANAERLQVWRVRWDAWHQPQRPLPYYVPWREFSVAAVITAIAFAYLAVRLIEDRP